MTRLQLIQLIGDLIEKIDVLRGSLLPTDPKRQALDNLRQQLDDQQRRLAQIQFDENTQAFQKAASDLGGINREIQTTLTDINQLSRTIANVTRLVNAVDGLLALAIP